MSQNVSELIGQIIRPTLRTAAPPQTIPTEPVHVLLGRIVDPPAPRAAPEPLLAPPLP